MQIVWPRARVALLFLGLAVVPGKANAEEPLPKGVVIDRVICRDSPAQTYALYLPSTYSPEVPAPILFCFDPGARGKVPVELFRPAAEKLGYIVVGSNNSRNGPWEPIQTAIEAMVADTGARFSIDRSRVYTAGMSGGGGPAWALANTGLAGAIICASALEMDDETLKGVTFAFFATAGIADFNYHYLDKHTEKMLELKKAARLEVFEGAHSWPPEEQATMGLEWMELQAMKSGRRSRDEAFIARILEKDLTRARDLEAQERLYAAFRTWRGIALDFAGLREVSDFKARADALGILPAVREARRQEAEMAETQELRARRLLQWRTVLETSQVPTLGTLSESGDSPADNARRDLARELSALRKRAEGKEFDREKIVAQRVLDHFYVNSIYHARDLLEHRSYAAAAVVLNICTSIRPRAAALFFDLARAHAGRRDKKKAFESLEKAIEAGYRDLEAIAGTPEFERLRKDKRFQDIVKTLEAGRLP